MTIGTRRQRSTAPLKSEAAAPVVYSSVLERHCTPIYIRHEEPLENKKGGHMPRNPPRPPDL